MIGTILRVGSFLLLAWLERRRPLRVRVEPKLRHEGRNLAIAGFGAAALTLLGAPLIQPLTALVERRRWGLTSLLPLHAWMKLAVALVLMDYTFYLWHRLAHRLPLLWRFHLVHHVDLDLDASTALRFHFGELLAGVPWQAAQVVLIGITPGMFSVWNTIFLMSIFFHHSAVEIPIEWERRLSWFAVTPRMHGIHHSADSVEMNSNLSSGLNIWDRLHRTLRLNVPQAGITIGVTEYRNPREVGLIEMVRLPFGSIQEAPAGEIANSEASGHLLA